MTDYPAPPSDALNGIGHMRDSVLFDGPNRGRRSSRFWILLLLSAAIAAAGVVSDSTAAVIGAMIVAPMMVPIQGAMLSTVLGDRVNLLRSIALIVAGAAAAVAIGFLVALFVVHPVTAANNSQVAGRVSPGLIDLFAALATGVVGSIALVRKDIADTLPGVAIAISLVPPLSVCGIALEGGRPDESLGALLLFVTNVAAILGTGVVVMALFGVQRWGIEKATPAPAAAMSRRSSYLAIGAMIVIVAIPLTYSSVVSTEARGLQSRVETVSQAWAKKVGWEVVTLTTDDSDVLVRFTGPEPVPDSAGLTERLSKAGVDVSRVEADFIPSYRVDLGAT